MVVHNVAAGRCDVTAYGRRRIPTGHGHTRQWLQNRKHWQCVGMTAGSADITAARYHLVV